MLSIVEHRSIWLSSQWHLNDSSEGKVFCKIASAFAEQEGYSKDKIESLQNILNKYDFYVNCLTTHRDMLSQWRGYANDGKGVCIGFNSEALKTIVSGSSIGLLYPVTYADDPTKIPEKLHNLLKQILESSGEPREKFIQSLTKEAWAVKSKAFSEEDESRIILTPQSNATQVEFKNGAIAKRKYRATETDIRDYYELEFGNIDLNDLICEVVLGPKNTSDSTVIERMLDNFDLRSVKVTRSAASYR
jgi:hypothetical protein